MKIKLEVEVELFDWTKKKTLSLRSDVGRIEHDDGTTFEVTQSAITFEVNRKGYPTGLENKHVASVSLGELLKTMSEKLVEHEAEIDKEDAAA